MAGAVLSSPEQGLPVSHPKPRPGSSAAAPTGQCGGLCQMSGTARQKREASVRDLRKDFLDDGLSTSGWL